MVSKLYLKRAQNEFEFARIIMQIIEDVEKMGHSLKKGAEVPLDG